VQQADRPVVLPAIMQASLRVFTHMCCQSADQPEGFERVVPLQRGNVQETEEISEPGRAGTIAPLGSMSLAHSSELGLQGCAAHGLAAVWTPLKTPGLGLGRGRESRVRSPRR